jgi:DNA-binding response OmpR family regulator
VILTVTRTKHTVFVLDDEPIIAETLRLILKRYGYEATKFTSSSEAWEAIKSNPPDLLLSDVGLPDITGVDLAIRITDEKIPTKILLLSGQSVTNDYLDDAAQRGYNFKVLPKPIAPQQLLMDVESMLNGQH